MNTPAINHLTKVHLNRLRTNGDRSKRRFVVMNKEDVRRQRFDLGCEVCGHKGHAVLLLPKTPGGRFPTHFVWTSRTTFLAALSDSKRVCSNCDIEARQGIRKMRPRRTKLILSEPPKILNNPPDLIFSELPKIPQYDLAKDGSV
jgi:hypothetical protein